MTTRRKVWIIHKKTNKKLPGVLKIAHSSDDDERGIFLLTNLRDFCGHHCWEKEKEGFEYSWILEWEHRAKLEKLINLKELKQSDFSIDFPGPIISGKYNIVFSTTTKQKISFEEIKL